MTMQGLTPSHRQMGQESTGNERLAAKRSAKLREQKETAERRMRKVNARLDKINAPLPEGK